MLARYLDLARARQWHKKYNERIFSGVRWEYIQRMQDIDDDLDEICLNASRFTIPFLQD
jgi:hypothetical protein